MDYGDITVLSQRGYPMFGDGQQMLQEIKDRLHSQYVPEDDYLLLVGDPLLIAAVVHFAASKTDHVRCLKWDRQERRYIPVMLTLNP